MSIEFNSVMKSFSGRNILNGVSFSVKKGEILFILGRSGVGKSVTLKLLVGLLKPDSGRVLMEGQDVGQSDELQLAQIRRNCGMVFQHPALFDSLNIFDNISFGIRDLPLAQKQQRVRECLRLVQLEEEILTKKPPEISFGMQKRASLARTLALQPTYILFDEPTTGLDPVTTNTINELIFNLSRTLQVSSLVVSHDMGCALKIADRIIILDQGKVLANGSVEEIKQNQDPLIRGFLAEVLSESKNPNSREV